MLKRSAVVLAAVAAVAIVCLTTVAVVWRQSQPRIEERIVGVWQETRTDAGYKLTVRPDAAVGDSADYTVTYPRSFKAPFSASVEGDRVVIWGENTKDVVWYVDYDAGADELTLTRSVTGQRLTLRRLSE